MNAFIRKYPVLVFSILTLSYQFIVVGLVKWMVPEGSHMHDVPEAWMVFRFRAFGPLFFAVALTWYLEGAAGMRKLFGAFLNWRVGPQWYALAFSWKILFTYLGIGGLVLFGMAEWPGWFVHDFFGGTFKALKGLIVNLPFIIGIAFVEETAWMKFSVTRLQEKYSALRACLTVGVAWGLWYLPMLLVGEGVPDGYPWPVFLLSMVCLTVLLGWAYNMTHSGTVLLIMQIISNCAFFLIPVLPAWHGGDATYVTAFVAVNLLSAITLVLVYGWRELGTGPRSRWSDGPAQEEEVEAELAPSKT